jgi:hypothetical protein
LELVFGDLAKPLASMAFARYIEYRRNEQALIEEKELDQKDAA